MTKRGEESTELVAEGFQDFGTEEFLEMDHWNMSEIVNSEPVRLLVGDEPGAPYGPGAREAS